MLSVSVSHKSKNYNPDRNNITKIKLLFSFSFTHLTLEASSKNIKCFSQNLSSNHGVLTHWSNKMLPLQCFPTVLQTAACCLKLLVVGMRIISFPISFLSLLYSLRHILQELLKDFLPKCCFLHINLLLPCSLFFWKRKGVSIFLGPSHQDGRRQGVKKKNGMYYTVLCKNA